LADEGGIGVTRDEILAMEPGEELNLLVGEKVFGLKFTSFPRGKCYYVDGMGWHTVNDYSTRISDAWEVVERMHRWGGCNLGCYGSRHGKVKWVVVDTIAPNGHHKVTAHTAPEAICKAALLVVMEG
jgi:hypothetical protein